MQGHRISSIILGAPVTGVVGGWLGYQMSGKSYVLGGQLGLTYGMLVGAALANYFSSKTKKTNLFWGLMSTLIFIAYVGVFMGVEVVKEGWWNSLSNAIATVLVGVEIILLAFLRDRVTKGPRGGVEKELEEEADDAWEDDGPSAAVSTGLFGWLSARWRSLGRFRITLILFAVAAAGSLAFWGRAELGRWVSWSAPADAGETRNEAHNPAGMTREGDTYSITLSGCQRERFNTGERVRCQFYITNKTGSDYKLYIDPYRAVAVDDLGVDHTPMLAQIGEGRPSQDATKYIPGRARIVVWVFFGVGERFESSMLSLLRITMAIANEEHKIAFSDVRIAEADAEVPRPTR
jgi:hypothetical protein